MSAASSIDSNTTSSSRKRMKLVNDDIIISSTCTPTATSSSLPLLTDNEQNDDRDLHVHVLLTLEYHGTDYGGWQRQGPNNKIVYPSVQGTLEQAVTEACHLFAANAKYANANTTRQQPIPAASKVLDGPHNNHHQAPLLSSANIMLIPTTENNGDCRAVMAGTSGRTDRAVHALDHHCLLRLPLAKSVLYTEDSGLSTFLMGQPPATATATTNSTSVTSSPFLTAVNTFLPCDIHVLTCRTMTQKQRKDLHFCRKRYCYIMQQAPAADADADAAASSLLLNRPWPAWNDYTYFVKQPLDVTQMERALSYMVGRHNFLPLSCHKDKIHTVRTLYSGNITVVEHPFEEDEEEEDANLGDNTSTRQRQRQRRLPWFQEAVRKSSLLTSTSNHQDGGDDDNDDGHHTTESNNNNKSLSSSSRSIFSPPHYGAANLTVHPKNNQLRPELYKFICIEVEGNGFLKHQVRRMVSVLQKVGEGVWPPDIVLQILQENIHDNNNSSNSNNNNNDSTMQQKTLNGHFLKGLALAPARALFKAKVWMGDDRKDTPIIAPPVMDIS